MKKENDNTENSPVGIPDTGESTKEIVSRGDFETINDGHEREILAGDFDFTEYMRTAKEQYGSLSYPGNAWSDIRGRLTLRESGKTPQRWGRAIAVIAAAAMVLIILLMKMDHDGGKPDTLPFHGTAFRLISVPSSLPGSLRHRDYFKIPDKPAMPSLTFSVPPPPNPPRERHRILSRRGVNHV